MSLHDALGPLYDHLFTLGSDQVTLAELAGFVTGAWGVWLTVRRRISNFGIGIANNIVFLLLFLDARLYADAGLQIVFAVLGAQGWWAWLRRGPDKSRLRVRRTGRAHADLIYVPLYASKDLVLTAVVYVIFLMLCVLGARDWRRSMTATGIWHEPYCGTRSATVEALAALRRPDPYLLTSDIGVDWEDDGMRDGRDIRAWMTGRFRDRLRETGVPVVECSGDRATRLAIARAAVVEISRWAFTAPIGAAA